MSVQCCERGGESCRVAIRLACGGVRGQVEMGPGCWFGGGACLEGGCRGGQAVGVGNVGRFGGEAAG